MEKPRLPLISAEEWEIRKNEMVKEFRKEIDLKFLRNRDIYSSLSVKGDPKKLHRMIKNEMEVSHGYDVTYDPGINLVSGAWSDQVANVDGKIFGYKEYKLKGSLEYYKPITGFVLCILGIILYFFMPNLIREIPRLFLAGLFPWIKTVLLSFSSWLETIVLLLVTVGVWYELLVLPHERYSLIPAYNKIWVIESGEAYLGTKEERVSEAGLANARGERVISLRYLAGDIDINFGAETKPEDVEVELKKGDFASGDPLDPKKYKRTMGFRAILNLRKKIKYRNDARREYLGLTKDPEEPRRDLKKDIEALRDKLTKFVEVK